MDSIAGGWELSTYFAFFLGVVGAAVLGFLSGRAKADLDEVQAEAREYVKEVLSEVVQRKLSQVDEGDRLRALEALIRAKASGRFAGGDAQKKPLKRSGTYYTMGSPADIKEREPKGEGHEAETTKES